MSRRLALAATLALVGCPEPEPAEDPDTSCRAYVDAANACYAAQGSTTTLDADALCAVPDSLTGAEASASNELFDCIAAAYESADCSTTSGVSAAEQGVALCSGYTGDTGWNDTWDTGDSCVNSITPFPENGETHAFYRTTVEARLQVADATAVLSLTDALGFSVPGVSTVQANLVTFQSSAPLQPSAGYGVTLDYACGYVDWSFTVNEVGTPTSGSLDGTAYAIDLSRGRYVRPEGLGDLLGQFLTTQVLLGVQGSTADTLETIGATAEAESFPPTEDLCVPTVAFPVADFTQDPYFVIDGVGTRVPLTIAGYAVTIDDLVMSGAFSPDASSLGGVRLTGSLDTYPLAEIVDATCVDGSPDYPACLEAVCDLAAVIGGCETCPADGQVHCLNLVVDSLVGDGILGPLVARSQAEVDADVACQP